MISTYMSAHTHTHTHTQIHTCAYYIRCQTIYFHFEKFHVLTALFLSIEAWEHPHDSISPSYNTFSSPSSLIAKLRSTQQTSLQLFPHFTSQKRSLSPTISLRPALLGAKDRGNCSTIHANQLCQLANGRSGWTAGDHYKRGQFSKL